MLISWILLLFAGQYWRHMRNHSDKVFNCPHCDYSTKHRSLLKQHVNGQHTDRKYTCNYCEYTSGYRENTLKHMKLCAKKHGIHEPPTWNDVFT